MERPVIVNSLLCFLSNFRHQSNIRLLLNDYFSKSAIEEARHILFQRFSSLESICVSDDIIDLVDFICKNQPDLQFAATDLSILPLALPSTDKDKGEILTELRALRTFITDALEGKLDDVADTRDSSTPTNRWKINNAASSPEIPITPSQQIADNNSKLWSSTQNSSEKTENTPLISPNANSKCGKRKSTGRSLDATVKKLNEKRKAEVDEPCSTTVSSWQPAVDPQAYLNMIRMMQSPQNTTNIFGNMLGQIQRLSGQSCSENGDDKDADDDEGSPSPSEETRDDFPLLEMSIDNDSDKPFVCEHANCHKRFANKFLLKKHQFIHTGLRPHTCPFCSKRFNRKDNLLRHKKTHLQNGLGEDLLRQSGLSETISELFPSLSTPLVTVGSAIKLEADHNSISTV